MKSTLGDMRAIVVEQNPIESVLSMRNLLNPAPGPRRVKIRVRTASVDRADLAQRRRTHQRVSPDSAPVIVGLDAAGDVVAGGCEVDET